MESTYNKIFNTEPSMKFDLQNVGNKLTWRVLNVKKKKKKNIINNHGLKFYITNSKKFKLL